MHIAEEIGARLQEERKRLKLNQDELGNLLGVSRRTIAAYEAGASEAGMVLLSNAAKVGFDILYVITGERMPEQEGVLMVEELELLMHVRSAAEEDQGAIKRLAKAISRSPNSEKKSVS